MIRFLLTSYGCPHCKKYLGIIQDINFKLPPNKRIKVVDVTYLEDYNVCNFQILRKINYRGTPFLYVDGIHGINNNAITVHGATSEEFVREYLNELLKEEFVYKW